MPDFTGQNQFGRQQQTQIQTVSPQSGGTMQAVFQCCPVLSRDEAVRAQIDLFGPGLIMPNLGQGMVYLKRFNAQKGEAEFLDFAYVPPPPPPAPAPSYDPQGAISAMRADMAALQASVSALCGEIEKSRKNGTKTSGGKAAEG